MAGNYLLQLGRARVTEHRDGAPTGRKWGPGTFTIRDGVAQLTVGADHMTMAARTYTKAGRTYTVPCTDDPALAWVVARKGG